MAIIYVDSNAGGLNNGTSWTDAYTTLQAALTAWTTADVIYWEHDSNEVYSTHQTLTCPNATLSDPCIIYSVDSSDDSYSPKRGNKGVGGTSNYQLDNTTNWNIIYWNFNARVFGASIKCNRDFRFAINTSFNIFRDCDIRSTPTVAGSLFSLFFGTAGQTVMAEFHNTDFSGTNDFQIAMYSGDVKIYGGSIDYSSDNAGEGMVDVRDGGDIYFYGVDMGNCTSFDALTYTSPAIRPYTITFDQCELPSGVSVDGGASTINGNYVRVNGSDSSTAYERSETHMNSGDVITTNSVYVDASDAHYASSNQYSYEMTPGADCDHADPLWFEFLAGVVESTGSKDFSIEIAHDYASSLTDADIHFELHYGSTANSSTNQMTSSAPQGLVDPLAAGTTLTSSSVSWTGAAGLTKQKMEVTATVNRIGPVYARVVLNNYEATKSVHVNSQIDIA